MFTAYNFRVCIVIFIFLVSSLCSKAQETLKIFSDASGKMGYKNMSGTIIVPAKYDEAKLFNKGFAPVRLNKKWGIIDQKGIEIVPLKYDELDYGFIRNFEKGPVRARIGEKWGFVNQQGKEIVPLKYDMVNSFSDGLAWVMLNYKWGFVNISGKEIVSPKYEMPELGPYDDDEFGFDNFDYYFQDGMAAFYSKNKYGFLDKSGKEIVPAKYAEVVPFTNGFAAVMTNNLWGFINKSGKEVVPPKFKFVHEFACGIAAVSLNSKWGFVNGSGKEVVSLKYTNIRDCSEGLAAVAMEGKWGFIDSTGKEVIPLQYSYVNAKFKNGEARVTDFNKKTFRIDKTGKPVNSTTATGPTNNNVNVSKPNNTTQPSNSSNANNNNTVPTTTNPKPNLVLKGSIDPSIAGSWKYYDSKMDMSNYFVFRADGTYDYYPGFIAANNSLASKNCNWRIDGNFIELACPGYEKVQRLAFQKKNDAATGKAGLLIEFKAAISNNRMYVTEDNKAAWK